MKLMQHSIETHSRVGFQCEKGYTLVGEGEGECRGSEWVGINGSNLKTPSCVGRILEISCV